MYAKDSIGLIEASNTIKFAVADGSLPEFPNTLIAIFGLILISGTLALLKIKKKTKIF